MLTTKKLLERINLKIPFKVLANQISNNFGLGFTLSFKPLIVGYEEVNSLLVTTKGRFVVKIFSKDKGLKTIKSNVTALLEYYNGDIPVPKLYQYEPNKYLYKVKQNDETFLIVMDYFDGKKFTNISASLEDKINIAKILTKIHKLNFETSTNYDIWLTIHLAREFEKKKKYLSKENFGLVEPVVRELKKIDLGKLSKSIVHFDLHRENVMKNSEGNYCVLDLASTDFNYKVFDIATYLALFCTEFGMSREKNIEIYKKILEEYLSKGSLNNYEKNFLLVLIKATFASNLLIPEFLQKSGYDKNPEQTIYYKSIGKRGLEMLNGMELF